MTNSERIQSNNEELRELIEIAENLPDAGGGGGEPADPILQEKSVTPTKSAQEVTADDGYDGLSKVSVGAIPATYQDITGTTAESNHVLEGKFFVNNDGVITEGTMPDCGGERVTLDVTNQGYDISEGYHDGTGEVYINLETKSVTPTKSAQTITPSSYRVLSKVNVGAIPDEYIVPTGTKQITSNGTHDATEYAAVEVNVPSQEPFTIPLGVTANGTYEPPDGVDGYNKVTVNVPIPDGYIVPSGAKEITENGEYDVTAYASVNVNVASGGGTPDNRALYQRVEYIESAVEGTYPYIITDFFADNTCGVEVIASFPVLQDRIPMGSRENSDATRFYCVYPLSANSIYHGFNTGVTTSCALKADTIYRLQTNFLNSRLVCVYDEVGARKANVSLSVTLTKQTAPVAIFGYNSASSGTVTSKREYKLYSARCSRGHEVVREYIPCYRKSDGVVGVYEKFTGQFLTSETGTFANGAEVEWED